MMNGLHDRSGAGARGCLRNPPLLCAYHALMMSLFPMAVITLFQRDQLGLSIGEIMTIQAAFGASLAIFEFPSGYLADRIGYRRSLVLAAACAVTGWTAYTLATGFASVLLAEIGLGLAISLVSGTTSALLYESLAQHERERDFARWFGRMRFFGQVAEGSAALVAGLLFAWSPRLPFALMVLVWLTNLGVALILVEPPGVQRSRERPLTHVRELVHFAFVRAPRLRSLFAVGVALGLSSFVPVWLVALYARDAGVPVSWLGPIWAAANYVVALGSIASHRLERRLGFLPVLAICCALVIGGYVGMGGTHAWWGFVFYFAFNLSRGLANPVLAHAEQREMRSGDRASLVSLRSLLFRASFVVVGPVTGLAIDRHGQHAVLIVLGVVLGGLASWATLRLRARLALPNAVETGSSST